MQSALSSQRYDAPFNEMIKSICFLPAGVSIFASLLNSSITFFCKSLSNKTMSSAFNHPSKRLSASANTSKCSFLSRNQSWIFWVITSIFYYLQFLVFVFSYINLGNINSEKTYGVRSCNITFYLLVLIFLIALLTVINSRQYILLSICYIARPWYSYHLLVF